MNNVVNCVIFYMILLFRDCLDIPFRLTYLGGLWGLSPVSGFFLTVNPKNHTFWGSKNTPFLGVPRGGPKTPKIDPPWPE